MSEKIIVFCDYCNTDQSTDSGRGTSYLECDTEMAISEFDWVMTPFGVKCLICQEKDEEVKE